jgi:hypothetical protein
VYRAAEGSLRETKSESIILREAEFEQPVERASDCDIR